MEQQRQSPSRLIFYIFCICASQYANSSSGDRRRRQRDSGVRAGQAAGWSGVLERSEMRDQLAHPSSGRWRYAPQIQISRMTWSLRTSVAYNVGTLHHTIRKTVKLPLTKSLSQEFRCRQIWSSVSALDDEAFTRTAQGAAEMAKAYFEGMACAQLNLATTWLDTTTLARSSMKMNYPLSLPHSWQRASPFLEETVYQFDFSFTNEPK